MRLVKKTFFATLVVIVAIVVSYLYVQYRLPRRWDATGQAQNNLRVLKRVAYYIHNNYVAPDTLDNREMLKKALHIMQQGLAPVMVRWKGDDKVIIEVSGKSRRFDVPPELELRNLPNFLGHIVDFVKANLPKDDENTTEENVEYLLIGGVVSALDPHSTFLRPKIYSEFKIGTSGNFGGVGIAIGIRDGYLTVISPLEGTPAFRAGLKAADRIIQIEDEPTINMTLTEAVERLRGKIGTIVTVLIKRENVPDPLSFTIRRALITIDSVKAELLPNEKIALVKIKNFQEDTLSEFHRSLRRLSSRTKGLDGIILDLRNNPGGLLDQSVSMADAFLEDGIIVSTVGLSNQLHEEDRARRNDVYESIPVVVLVNEGSASASEILAGAIQSHGRAIILGNRTFGKGTVQTLYDLKDGSALKLTIAKYLAAGTEDVQTAGIMPDVLMMPQQVSDKRIDLVENQARREHDLEKRFDKKDDGNKPKEAKFKLSYLDTTEKPENITGTVQLSHDYPVELATRILRHGVSPNKESELKAVSKIISEIEAEQDKVLIEALKKENIDWSKGPKKGEPKADLKLWFSSKDKKIKTLVGDQDIKIHISVKNNGNGPFYRLLAVTESENPLFSDLEFPLGRINPGESQQRSVDVKIPATIPAQRIPINIKFQELHGHVPETTEIPIDIQEAKDPRFTYQWALKNPKQEIKPGQDIELVFSIRNIGTAAAKEPVLNLANQEKSHVILKKGRAKLDPIEPGKSTEASLTIHLKPDLPLNEARMIVAIEDRNTGYSLHDRLILAETKDKYSPPMSQWQEPPNLKVDLPEQPFWRDKKKYQFSGMATDDDKIKEIYVFANFDKVFYESIGAEANSTAPFDVTVPLEPGLNRINVIVKDKQDLTARKRWIVWRPKD